MQSSAGGVERELADGDSHAAGALIAKAEDAFAVADYDGFDVVETWMTEDAPNDVLVRQAQKQPAGFAKNMAEKLAAEAHRRRVDDGHHFLDVLRQQRIKQGLVGVLQSAQEDVLVKVAGQTAEGGQPALHLHVEGRDTRRQQA